MERTITLDAIQRDIDLFQERADPAVMAPYERPWCPAQPTADGIETGDAAMLDELQQLRRQRAAATNVKIGVHDE